MRRVVILRALPTTAGGWINFSSIDYKGNKYRITKDWRCVLNSEALPSDEPLFMRIEPASPYSLNYDDDPNNKDHKNSERKKCAEIIPYHNQMNTIEGFLYHLPGGKTQAQNPNAGGAMLFEFEDLGANHAKDVKIIKTMGAAYNKANEMSYAEKLKVMYFYGENPTDAEGKNMKHSEVFKRLLEPILGIVYRRNMFAQTGKTYLDHFVNEYDSADAATVLKTTILKALFVKTDSGTLVRKEGTAWMFGNDAIGSTVEEAMVWFMNHEELKKHVLSMVAKSDTQNDDDLDEVMTKFDLPSDGSLKLKAKDEYENLKARAKAMRIPLPGVPTVESLNTKIAEAEPIWDKVRELNMADEIAGQPKLRIEQIHELVKAKQRELLKKDTVEA